MLALNAAPGEVDVMVASELLEAVRAIQAGFVSPDRTVLIASTQRVSTRSTKSRRWATAGSIRSGWRSVATQVRDARQCLPISRRPRQRRNAQQNAVMLGALAGSGASADLRRGIPCRDRRRRQGGRSQPARLRGRLALAADGGGRPSVEGSNACPLLGQAASDSDLEARRSKSLPVVAAGIAAEGVRRLVDYQGPEYASLYLDRLAALCRKRRAPTRPFIRELARHLAVRMSFEDTIRVAQLKIKEGRVERLRSESKVRDKDLIDVTEFLKPGPEEIFSMLPPGARARGAAGFRPASAGARNPGP